MQFDISVAPDGLTLTPKRDTGILHRLFRRGVEPDLTHLSDAERSLAFAIADAKATADEIRERISVDSDRIFISHRVAASLGKEASAALGLPPLVDFTLKTDVEGIVGSTNFRLRYEWSKNGQRQLPVRAGSILQTANGQRRMPLWMLDAIEVADGFASRKDEMGDWEALARYRKALDPAISLDSSDAQARISMTDFLSGLEVKLADSFSISPRSDEDFDIVPFSTDTLDASTDGFSEVSEDMSEVEGLDRKAFQTLVRGRGALPAYRLSPGKYLVVDRGASPALEVMATMQKSSPEERRGFIRNPLPKLTEAFERNLRARGKLEGLSQAAEEEAIEAALSPSFIETREYAEFSDRVTGVVKFEKPDLGEFEGSGTTWLPEDFARKLADVLSSKSKPELEQLRERIADAVDQGLPQVEFEDVVIPARPEAIRLLDERIAAVDSDNLTPGAELEPAGEKGPFVLDTEVNFDELKWHATLRPRSSSITGILPDGVRTPLKSHQVESFQWQIDAWRAGLPGVLNADEQGLGKTLQTIAFLSWIKSVTASTEAKNRGPILIVAPTSLLENWEQEVRNHMDEDGLGHLIRLYGSGLGSRKMTGAKGKDTDDAIAKLDLRMLQEAVSEGRAHRFWLLTTYTTLTNYQHSLARIPFSVAVFDEIQALKNPVSLRAAAARTVNANFRIGLTGTPIENSTVDLWAITDQLAPGSLDSLKEFRQRYAKPDDGNMAELHSRVFVPQGRVPALAIRRLKETVAKELPTKSRRIHPRLMPEMQAIAYDDARIKLASGGPGAQLKMLHHIRTVSVHPALDGRMTDAEFVGLSGRLSATMDILRHIREKRERALVFIEHRQMQYRFIELAKASFGLHNIDLINGDTPIPQRQAIVNRFQRHLSDEPAFDLLVLGPKAAGTGLTLTAATHVIHLSRWWNPAVEEQCNDRVHRIGQSKPVTVHVPMAIHAGYREHSFDCLLQSLMMRKRRLASAALWPMGDTQDDMAELQRLIGAERSSFSADPILAAVSEMYARDQQELPPRADDGSYPFH
jgi:SNF2 family DNA or RNA helicase